MILIIRNGRRLCNDLHWREFASYGSMSSCVKVYKSLGHAIRKRNHINAINNYQHNGKGMAQVINLPDGHEINAAGQVTERVPVLFPDTPGFERIIEHKMEEFIVEITSDQKELVA